MISFPKGKSAEPEPEAQVQRRTTGDFDYSCAPSNPRHAAQWMLSCTTLTACLPACLPACLSAQSVGLDRRRRRGRGPEPPQSRPRAARSDESQGQEHGKHARGDAWWRHGWCQRAADWQRWRSSGYRQGPRRPCHRGYHSRDGGEGPARPVRRVPSAPTWSAALSERASALAVAHRAA